MAKYKVTVTRTDEYEVECDWTPEEIKAWNDVYTDVETKEDVVKELAIAWMKNEDRYVIGDFGYVRQIDDNGNTKSVPFQGADGKLGHLPDDKFTNRISVHPISQDKDYDVEVKLIEPVTA